MEARRRLLSARIAEGERDRGGTMGTVAGGHPPRAGGLGEDGRKVYESPAEKHHPSTLPALDGPHRAPRGLPRARPSWGFFWATCEGLPGGGPSVKRLYQEMLKGAGTSRWADHFSESADLVKSTVSEAATWRR